jgi:hypothetical protein
VGMGLSVALLMLLNLGDSIINYGQTVSATNNWQLITMQLLFIPISYIAGFGVELWNRMNGIKTQ